MDIPISYKSILRRNIVLIVGILLLFPFVDDKGLYTASGLLFFIVFNYININWIKFSFFPSKFKLDFLSLRTRTSCIQFRNNISIITNLSIMTGLFMFSVAMLFGIFFQEWIILTNSQRSFSLDNVAESVLVTIILGTFLYLQFIIPAVLFIFFVLLGLISVSRFHDRNKSGFWALILLIPVFGFLWLIIECLFFRGTEGQNKYGEDPNKDTWQTRANNPGYFKLKPHQDFMVYLVGIFVILLEFLLRVIF